MAIPSSRESLAYERLKRVWFDHTWTGHPFMDFKHENHLTATLFENFSIFSPTLWLPQLLAAAGLPHPQLAPNECCWGYEVLDPSSNKLADAALHARFGEEDMVIVIESKRKGGRLKPSDGSPSSYLDLEEFKWCPNRKLIYMVDESDLPSVLKLVDETDGRSGITTWQELGALQIRLTESLPISETLRSFVAGAIQFQFLQHGINPSTVSRPYLTTEPSKDIITKDNPDKMKSYATAWRLPECASSTSA